ncbi:hypothetical protein ACUM6W_04460 [Acinetobacter tandoii]|jgi:hypothetical protein|uniref:hypothetical protein n=1 Tax=Acinetobacter tandoii TaxID=202954 RepID=UPI0040451F4A
MAEQKKSVNQSLTPVGNNSVAKVYVNPQEKCNTVVNMALNNVYGSCGYYYVPYKDDPIKKGEVVNKNGINIRYFLNHADVLIDVRKTQERWQLALDVALKVIINRESLLKLDGADPNWSRYSDFMKRHTKNCGHLPPTYYRAYGYYYCSRFGAYLLPSMKSKEGKDWLKDARYLLQKYMDRGLDQNNIGNTIKLPCKLAPKASQTMTFAKQTVELNDKTFKTFAFNSHVPAYIDGGIKNVPFPDLCRIIAEPNLQEWMDTETLRQAQQVAFVVVPDLAQKALDASKEGLNKAANTIEDGFNNTVDNVKSWF